MKLLNTFSCLFRQCPTTKGKLCFLHYRTVITSFVGSSLLHFNSSITSVKHIPMKLTFLILLLSIRAQPALAATVKRQITSSSSIGTKTVTEFSFAPFGNGQRTQAGETSCSNEC